MMDDVNISDLRFFIFFKKKQLMKAGTSINNAMVAFFNKLIVKRPLTLPHKQGIKEKYSSTFPP